MQEIAFRTTADELRKELMLWDELLPGRGRIHLIACGGTALTLLGYKESTKDVDLLVPKEKEYRQLTSFLQAAGYRRITSFGWKHRDETILYDLYPGKRVYMTELLTSPLRRGGNRKIHEGNKIYLGVLNVIDLIITKVFRGSSADLEDCLALARCEKIDFGRLEKRCRQTAKYDVSEDRILKNWVLLLRHLEQHGIHTGRLKTKGS